MRNEQGGVGMTSPRMADGDAVRVSNLRHLRRADLLVRLADPSRGPQSHFPAHYMYILYNTVYTGYIYLKRGSVQPGCILGGLRFRSTAIQFFKFVWYL